MAWALYILFSTIIPKPHAFSTTQFSNSHQPYSLFTTHLPLGYWHNIDLLYFWVKRFNIFMCFGNLYSFCITNWLVHSYCNIGGRSSVVRKWGQNFQTCLLQHGSLVLISNLPIFICFWASISYCGSNFSWMHNFFSNVFCSITCLRYSIFWKRRVVKD